MSAREILFAVAVVWFVAVLVGWCVVVPWLRRLPGVDTLTGLMWYTLRLYCATWHRARYVGARHVPTSIDAARGLIVVSNHTGPVDPLLIQSCCPFIIRWMMATDTMVPSLDWLWKHQRLIPVDRAGEDASALREAIRHVKAGGCVGIFPEGRIPVPPREIRPFFPGVGVLVRRTGAPILLVWVSGTPDKTSMQEALASRSHARVEFLGVIEYDSHMKAQAISEDLRRRIHAVSGWPFNDVVSPPGGESPQAQFESA